MASAERWNAHSAEFRRAVLRTSIQNATNAKYERQYCAVHLASPELRARAFAAPRTQLLLDAEARREGISVSLRSHRRSLHASTG